jgi:hypothetical protein
MNLLALAALLGTLLPPVTAVIQHEKWPKQVRAIVGGVIALAAAIGTVVGKGQWHGLDQTTADAVGTAFVGMIVANWGSYALWWQQLGVTQWIEKVTTFAAAHRDVVEKVLDELATASPEEKAQIAAALNQVPPQPQQPSGT